MRRTSSPRPIVEMHVHGDGLTVRDVLPDIRIADVQYFSLWGWNDGCWHECIALDFDISCILPSMRGAAILCPLSKTVHGDGGGFCLGQGTQNRCTPIDGTIRSRSNFKAMRSCQHISFQPHLQHQIDDPRRGFVECGKSSLKSASSRISRNPHLNIIVAIVVENPNADCLRHLSQILC
jgi:hypothetical protein